MVKSTIFKQKKTVINFNLIHFLLLSTKLEMMIITIVLQHISTKSIAWHDKNVQFGTF